MISICGALKTVRPILITEKLIHAFTCEYNFIALDAFVFGLEKRRDESISHRMHLNEPGLHLFY